MSLSKTHYQVPIDVVNACEVVALYLDDRRKVHWDIKPENMQTNQVLLYCRVKGHSKDLQVGGESVDAAVTAVFAALVWQTQQLRDDLEKYCK